MYTNDERVYHIHFLFRVHVEILLKRGRAHGRPGIKRRLLYALLILIALVLFNTIYIWLNPASPVESHVKIREDAIREDEIREDVIRDGPATVFVTRSTTVKHTEPTTQSKTFDFTQEYVACETTAGKLMFKLHPEWSPAGAQRFQELVTEGFFSAGGGNAVFRYAPKFMIQFGIVGDPTFDDTPGSTFQAFPDDKQSWRGVDGHSNVYERGMLAFAASGPNTRNTELFIMLRDHTTGAFSQSLKHTYTHSLVHTLTH